MATDVDDLLLRPPTAADHAAVIPHLDAWWGGRHMAPMLPRLFFVHFPDTSVVAEDPATGGVAGFLVGFHSRADDATAYIHFVGVAPDRRGQGLGRTLYRWSFERAREAGRDAVVCVTSPVNEGSLAFHRALGFDGTVVEGYDGPGEDRVVLTRPLR